MHPFRSVPILATVIVALALGACETTVVADAGYVVASVAKPAGSPYDSVTLAYRGADGSGAEKLIFSGGASSSAVAVAKLPPGQYELYSFNVKGPRKDYAPLFVFSIPFSVQSGTTTYLGQYLTLDNANEPYFVISNEQARDMTLAAKADATLATVPTRAAIPDPGKLPYFRKAPLPNRKR
jgi:hypothetical protein